jgi:glycosyltransferase involved in cell wall biosynthesis
MHDIGRLQGAEAVANAMQDADALLFPSRSEGLPLSVLEAMASGLPVIATRGSSLTEVVADGSSGILCLQDDVGAFSAAARCLAGDQALRQRMSNAAVERVARQFSLASTIGAYADVYAKCLRRGAEAL